MINKKSSISYHDKLVEGTKAGLVEAINARLDGKVGDEKVRDWVWFAQFGAAMTNKEVDDIFKAIEDQAKSQAKQAVVESLREIVMLEYEFSSVRANKSARERFRENEVAMRRSILGY